MEAEIEAMLRKGTICQIHKTQLAIPCGEKRQRSASSDKFEESKFVRVLRALQNRKFEFTPVSP